MTWEPIDTAPKDGSVVAVWNANQPDIVRYARWGLSRSTMPTSGCWLSRSRCPLTHLPTHWISLAPPPRSRQG